MKANKSIQLKAAFLLFVFSLNTVIGFACSIGMNLGFNATHHHNKEVTQSPEHVHADGKKHHHHKHQHNHKDKHQDQANNHQHKQKDGKDNCCNDEVTKFSQLEKTVPQSVNAVINPVFFTAFFSSFYDGGFISTSQVVPDIKHFVRSYHPPISDIRIAIQSFQI